MMNEKDRAEFHRHVERTTSERARVMAKQLAGSTTLATRFDLTEVKKLEGFLMSAFWLLENGEIDRGQFLMPIVGKDCS